MLVKHEGCLMSTDEGFEDVVAALRNAETLAVSDAPTASAEFANELRRFCAVSRPWVHRASPEPQ
jgi:hypothetical protein